MLTREANLFKFCIYENINTYLISLKCKEFKLKLHPGINVHELMASLEQHGFYFDNYHIYTYIM